MHRSFRYTYIVFCIYLVKDTGVALQLPFYLLSAKGWRVGGGWGRKKKKKKLAENQWLLIPHYWYA